MPDAPQAPGFDGHTGQYVTRSMRLEALTSRQYPQLLSALAVPETALASRCNTTRHPDAPVTLGGEVERVPLDKYLLGPVVADSQEELCWKWLRSRVDHEVVEDMSFAEHLMSGELLCRAVGEIPRMDPMSSRVATQVCQLNVLQFLRRARKDGVEADDLFEIEDLLLRRNLPRVLRTIAAVARAVDGENFVRIAGEIPGANLQWTEVDEPNETWEGDALLAGVVTSHRRVSGRRRLNIAVLGALGAGKSATINSLLGRRAVAESHNLAFEPRREDVSPALQTREIKLKRAFAMFWPLRFFEPGPHPSSQVAKSHVTIRGVTVSVTELPSNEVYVVDSRANGALKSSLRAGCPEETRKAMEHEHVDIIVLVERLDEFRSRDYKQQYSNVQSLFGANCWDRTVVVLTHGYSLPPEGLSPEEHIRRRTQLVQEHIHRTSGNASAFVPLVVVENSQRCPSERANKERTLPDGSAFMSVLAGALKSIVTRQHASEPLHVRGSRPWWEAWALGVGALWLVNQL